MQKSLPTFVPSWLLGVSLLAFSSTFVACSHEDEVAPVVPVAEAANASKAPITGHYIVVLKAQESSAPEASENFEADDTFAQRQGKMRSEVDRVLLRRHLRADAVKRVYGHALRGFAAQLSAREAAELAKDAAVAYVEADQTMSISQTTSTTPVVQPVQTVPYGITRVGRGDGTGKTAWIIDTGIDLTHPDLNVDKARSRSFLSITSGLGYDSPADGNGHGTHVAGTIGARNNAIGVVGVAANATVVALRVLDANGSGSSSGVIAAVDYVTANGKAGDVVNMSLGGGASTALDAAVVRAANRGILIAVAAGNNSGSATLNSPARVNHVNVFTISAMDNTDTWASFSNFSNPPIDYCMPGVRINSTYLKGGYATMSGTSMATPHMAGVLLVRGKFFIKSGLVKGDPDGTADPIAHL